MLLVTSNALDDAALATLNASKLHDPQTIQHFSSQIQNKWPQADNATNPILYRIEHNTIDTLLEVIGEASLWAFDDTFDSLDVSQFHQQWASCEPTLRERIEQALDVIDQAIERYGY